MKKRCFFNDHALAFIYDLMQKVVIKFTLGVIHAQIKIMYGKGSSPHCYL